jgi:DNA-binding Lrp family transcriptional regulator
MIDEKDLEILKYLKDNSKFSTSLISKKTKYPITTIHNRIKKLEEEKIIKKFTIDIDYSKLGKPLEAYIMVTVFNITPDGKRIEQTKVGENIKKNPAVEKVQIITGGSDILVQARVESMEKLNDFITKFIRKIDGVDKTTTIMVLKDI